MDLSDFQGALFAAAEPAASVRAPVLAAYGAGVDSTAYLIEMIERGETIDHVLFADTGSEKPATYAYLEMFRQWLAKRGVRLTVVRYSPKQPRHFPGYESLHENCITNATLPSISFGRSGCSVKWKHEPQNQWTADWEPARQAWAAGVKVVKLIGYDCSPADNARYGKAADIDDPLYEYRYPLREWGWTREDCKARIIAAGLPVPPKSACFMCLATQAWELHEMPAGQLRSIVLMEARAKPRLRGIEGLWRTAVKGTRGGTARPGSMTEYIRSEGLLPAEEIDEIIATAPIGLTPAKLGSLELLAEQAEEASPGCQIVPRSAWKPLLDMRERFAEGGARPLYAAAEV